MRLFLISYSSCSCFTTMFILKFSTSFFLRSFSSYLLSSDFQAARSCFARFFSSIWACSAFFCSHSWSYFFSILLRLSNRRWLRAIFLDFSCCNFSCSLMLSSSWRCLAAIRSSLYFITFSLITSLSASLDQNRRLGLSTYSYPCYCLTLI